jgi:hypothetical protein
MRQIVDIKDVLNIFSASQFNAQNEEKKEMALPCLSRPQSTKKAMPDVPEQQEHVVIMATREHEGFMTIALFG